MNMEDDFVPISALQHMLYCPRQCALIHLERQWADNVLTAEGHLLHTKVDDGRKETRSGIKTWRSVPMSSKSLGVFGVADVVEMHDGDQPYPVEYKRGRPKSHRADEVQLCAQAICLEEMLATEVGEGALFYGRTQRRKTILFDAELRDLTRSVASNTRELLRQSELPRPIDDKSKCRNCSLVDVCRPALSRGRSVGAWLAEAIGN